jgi:hypothetical protein
MTLTEFRRQVLFACLSNPALIGNSGSGDRKYPDASLNAIFAADDTVEYMLERGVTEKFGIDIDK